MIAAFMAGLVTIAGTVAGRVLLALGIGFVSYQGIGASVDWLQATIWGGLDSLPAEILGLIAVLKVDVAIQILLSAIAARLVIRGLTGGAFRKMVGL